MYQVKNFICIILALEVTTITTPIAQTIALGSNEAVTGLLNPGLSPFTATECHLSAGRLSAWSSLARKYGYFKSSYQ